jgi:hypothetical protein
VERIASFPKRVALAHELDPVAEVRLDGATTSQREGMRVLFASSEISPLAKTGGLADVSAALPAALTDLGVDMRSGH